MNVSFNNINFLFPCLIILAKNKYLDHFSIHIFSPRSSLLSTFRNNLFWGFPCHHGPKYFLALTRKSLFKSLWIFHLLLGQAKYLWSSEYFLLFFFLWIPLSFCRFRVVPLFIMAASLLTREVLPVLSHLLQIDFPFLSVALLKHQRTSCHSNVRCQDFQSVCLLFGRRW